MPGPKSRVPANGNARDRKYFQLWRRFYEPLVILKILGTTRGEHSLPLSQSPVHRFLDNLAYLCDHDKGGSTTSAVGLENAPEQFNLWIASNDPKQSAKSALFLTFILQDIRKIADAPDADKESLQGKLIRRCIEFAKQRVKKEAKLLTREAARCMRFFTSSKDTELYKWLGRFLEKEPEELCHLAYRERDTLMMKQLSSRQRANRDLSVTDGQSVAIKDVLHRLGRLSHHIRAPKQIVEDVSNHSGLRNVLDEFKVGSIRPQPTIDRPQAEPDIHIYSIMNRMLSSGLNERYKAAADVMNQRYDIVSRFKQEYDSKTFKPLMHAEIQVLEHFWAKRQFFDDDRYIGCSKPSCYCCHLYMQHHPARCVVPQTSRNVYVNWGLEALPQGTRDADYKHQRDLLNEMTKSIRNDALDQILRKTSAAPWHPDSQTGFTLRVPSRLNEAASSRMVDLDMTTDTDDSQSAGVDCSPRSSARGSRHSSWASISDASTRGLRDHAWIDDGDSDSDSDSSSGGAKL
ncbi:hypothetical protein GGS24DRAFT_455472 [Hypoxylon argillaceum]|nr:hypothetical protein GGS24DRAFT_455472 [Hypoxylon argillaceum]